MIPTGSFQVKYSSKVTAAGKFYLQAEAWLPPLANGGIHICTLMFVAIHPKSTSKDSCPKMQFISTPSFRNLPWDH